MDSRVCEIVAGVVFLENGSGDGAYDLLDITGSPDEIGKAVAESLKAIDLGSARRPSAVDAGEDIFLALTVKIARSK